VDINRAFPTEASLSGDAKLVLEALNLQGLQPPFAMSGRSTHLALMLANWDYASGSSTSDTARAVDATEHRAHGIAKSGNFDGVIDSEATGVDDIMRAPRSASTG
jgi:hypothetical protein